MKRLAFSILNGPTLQLHGPNQVTLPERLHPFLHSPRWALKEVTAKEAPEMTQEEVIGLQDLVRAFTLTQAQKNAQDDLLEALDTNETEV